MGTMSDRVRADDLVEELRQRFVASLRETVASVSPANALEAADALCETWLEATRGLLVAGRPRRRVDGEAIAADWRAGRPLREIRRRHGCSRAAAYKYHPNRTTRK